MKGNKRLEQNKHEEPISILSRSLLTGLIGGFFWSSLGVVMYYFNFSEVAPRTFLLRSWLRVEWTDGWLGDVISIIIVGLISVATAFIYYGLFKRINSMWMGALFGVILWGIIFYLMQPIFSNVPQLVELDINTIVSTVCLFILYGTFIGYSISYDYNDKVIKETEESEANG